MFIEIDLAASAAIEWIRQLFRRRDATRAYRTLTNRGLKPTAKFKMSLCDTKSGGAARGNMRTKTFIIQHLPFFALCLCVSAVNIPAQTGGTFDLSHSVIAGGGESNSTGGTFNVSGTVGQHVAGTASNGATFDLHGGFWFQNLAPTAAAVSITGRVTTSNGQGIRNARVTLTAPNGARRTAITSTFGYYAFDGVEVGHTYVLEIASKRYTFTNPTRVFSLQDHVTGMDFTGEAQ